MKLNPPINFRFSMNGQDIFGNVLEIHDEPGNVWFKISISTGLTDIFRISNGVWVGERDESNDYMEALKPTLFTFLHLTKIIYHGAERVGDYEYHVWVFQSLESEDKVHFFFEGELQFDAIKKEDIWEAVPGHDLPSDLVGHLVEQLNLIKLD